jgi:hypothetical protein
VCNAIAIETMLNIAAPFSPWYPSYYSTGAYVINREGCARIVSKYCGGREFISNKSEASGNLTARYILPEGVSNVADHLVYRSAKSYTYTRPLFEHENHESTIHEDHVEFHKYSALVTAQFYARLADPWEGDEKSPSALAAVQGGLANNLEWWCPNLMIDRPENPDWQPYKEFFDKLNAAYNTAEVHGVYWQV